MDPSTEVDLNTRDLLTCRSYSSGWVAKSGNMIKKAAADPRTNDYKQYGASPRLKFSLAYAGRRCDGLLFAWPFV